MSYHLNNEESGEAAGLATEICNWLIDKRCEYDPDAKGIEEGMLLGCVIFLLGNILAKNRYPLPPSEEEVSAVGTEVARILNECSGIIINQYRGK